jgi:hypothetical protein
MTWLTTDERNVLALVLELRLEKTRKGNPGLQPLSLYSSELKNLKQISQEIQKIKDGTFTSQEDRTKARYFRTLSIHGVASGTKDAPILTKNADIVFEVSAKDDGSSSYWQDHRNEVETPLFRAQVELIQKGEGSNTDEYFKQVFWNAQKFFELVPESKVESVLNNLDLLKNLQFINSVGFEIGRFFRLSEEEQNSFLAALKKVHSSFSSATLETGVLIEAAAYEYAQAASQFQADVRYRVAGFLRAFQTVKQELGINFPRIEMSLEFSVRTQLAHSTKTSVSKEELRLKALSRVSLNFPNQQIISGCPGSGKSFYIDQRLQNLNCQLIRTQFHSESSYFEFIGCYKPTPVYEKISSEESITSADGDNFALGRPMIDYRYIAGPFTKAMLAAYSHPDRNIVLLIEELNRGNCAAIFGDMFQLLDRDNSGQSKYEILPNPDLTTHFNQNGFPDLGEKLTLPANLYIWATMNSADQGVFPLDTAFRRRWDYVYKGHAEPCEYPKANRKLRYGNKYYDWNEFRMFINKKLRTLGVHEDKLVGPYFLSPKQIIDPIAVLNKLFLYLWDDVLRFRQQEIFLADNFSEISELWQDGNGSILKINFSDLQEFTENSADQSLDQVASV